MPLEYARCRELLRECNLQALFVEELGWDRHTQTLEVPLDGHTYALSAIAQKRGMVAFECPVPRPELPDYPTRRKIQSKVAKSVHEHLIVFVNQSKTEHVWQWVKREPGRPRQCREHRYHHTQPGDSLLQKLQLIAFALSEEEGLTLVDVTGRVRAAFDVDRVTRRFYDRFRSEHATFMKFLRGIPDEEMQRWYVSVMLNRLMFIYFIQKRGFLDDDINYLRNRLAESKRHGRDRFYRDFLCPLFFEGFAKREEQRSEQAQRLLGRVPYLNGGIFMRHQIEEIHGETIQIADAAFDRLFAFFDAYHWHLDERPLRADNEINPDVLGYIFEKYINQKQMGAYYSKEDITGYISQNTVIPYLLDEARRHCRIAFEGDASVWRLLQANPDRYIYDAVRRGVIDHEGQVIPESALPHFVQVGMHDPKARMFDRRYNLGEAFIPGPNGENLALPTETWREYVERRKRCLELRTKLAAGEIHEVNDLITYNLDIRQFAQDVIENCEGPELLRAFWRAIQRVTILDPACGSGAFLFAALNILEPLYEACLERMEAFLGDLERPGEKRHPRKFADFREVLERVDQHPNRRYFILKSIVLNNLFGVDIMEEAVEICKLRLFLKLVAQVERAEDIEPLPDIDFNIRAGNSLVGYAKLEDIRRGQGRLDFEDALARIDQKAAEVDELFVLFRQQQTELGGEVTPQDKAELRRRLAPLEEELNGYLAGEYGVDVKNKGAYERWCASHKPFHWLVEFYGIMSGGGFDVVIGNPPYVDYAKVRREYTIRGYLTETCGNLYAYFVERSLHLLPADSRFGMIVPVSSISGQAYVPLMSLFAQRSCWISSYSNRPGKLFEGVEQRLCIFVTHNVQRRRVFTSRYQHWYEPERQHQRLFQRLSYGPASTWQHSGMPIKSGGRPAESIFRRLTRDKRPLHLLTGGGSSAAWLHDGPTYWVRAVPFQPNVGRLSDRSNHYHPIATPARDDASVLAAILSSSTFYLFFKLVSNCRDLGQREWALFPFDGRSHADRKGLAKEGAALGERLKATAAVRSRRYPSGPVEYEEYYPARAKDVIDRIDQLLAQHYGFTDEELDFIINYDIKYRMGRDAANNADAEGQ